MEPVRSFRTLCLKCFATDTAISTARMDGKRIDVCQECGSVAVTKEGELVSEVDK